MAFTFTDLQNEVKRRATRDQAGTDFDTAIKNVINTSLFRLCREAKWRQLRRTTYFDTVSTYTEGTGAGTFTNGSKAVEVTGATFLTDGIQPGQRISLEGDSRVFTIRTITGEDTLTIDKNYEGTTISGTGEYSILAKEEYLLPIQASHRLFLWHEEYGYPYMMGYLTDQEFFGMGMDNTSESIPTHYRMWGEDMVREQLKEASVLTVASSNSADTSIEITVFGVVSGYPDYEVITTNSSNGTTSVNGSKSFSSVERVVKGSTSTGRITVTANSANTTVAVMPVGDTTAGILYRKVQLYPLPNSVFPVNVWYYKDPYRLVNGGDVHELGQEFDEAIILLATAKINYENNKDEGDKFFSLYSDEVRNLRKTNVDKVDWFPTLKRAGTRSDPRVHKNLAYHQVGPHFGWRA